MYKEDDQPPAVKKGPFGPINRQEQPATDAPVTGGHALTIRGIHYHLNDDVGDVGVAENSQINPNLQQVIENLKGNFSPIVGEPDRGFEDYLLQHLGNVDNGLKQPIKPLDKTTQKTTSPKR